MKLKREKAEIDKDQMEEEGLLLLKLKPDDGGGSGADDESYWCLLVAVLSNIPLILAADAVFIKVVLEFPLSTYAVAFYFASFIGAFFVLRLAMESVLNLLRNKPHGAEELKEARSEAYTAIFTLTLLAIPTSLLWTNMDKLLVLLGQRNYHEAGDLLAWLVPLLFAYATRLPLVQYFTLKRAITPLLVSSIVSFCVILTLGSILVFRGALQGALGVAVAIASGMSMWVEVLILAFYMEFFGAPNYVKVKAEEGA